MLLNPLHILVTGSSGLVGSSLVPFLEEKGHFVKLFKRGERRDLEGFDVIIHLAGESLSKGIWTKKKKERILKSRVDGTKNLLLQLKSPPKVFISASAVGYYGSREGWVTEESSPGKGFLSEVCQKWELASKPLEKNGTRVVLARFGYILSSKGGLLKTLLPLFKLGLGGSMGGGEQIMPWISLDDVVLALYHIIEAEELVGPVNIVSPNPVKQKVFAQILAKILRRPSIFAIPKWLLMGQKAKELILPSLQVKPSKLEKTGFIFKYSCLREALFSSLCSSKE